VQGPSFQRRLAGNPHHLGGERSIRWQRIAVDEHRHVVGDRGAVGLDDGAGEVHREIAQLEGRAAQLFDQAGSADPDLAALQGDLDTGGDDVAAGIERAVHFDPRAGREVGQAAGALEDRRVFAVSHDLDRLPGHLEARTGNINRLDRSACRGTHQQPGHPSLAVERGLDLLADLDRSHRRRGLGATVEVVRHRQVALGVTNAVDDHAAETGDRAADHRAAALRLRHGAGCIATAAAGSQQAAKNSGADPAQDFSHHCLPLY